MRSAVVAGSLALALLLAGCSDSKSVCPQGTASCAGACLPLASDAQNCGACGNVCGAGLVCWEGACLTATRTVSARFGVDHWLDDGSIDAIFGPPPDATVSALVPDGSAQGYQVIPGSVALDGTVTVPGVPRGDYLLAIDIPYTVDSCLPACGNPVTRLDRRVVQFATSTPPLGGLVSHRPDLQRASVTTPVQVSLTNLDPDSSPNSQLYGESSQADLDLWIARAPAGATELTAEVDWRSGYGPQVLTAAPTTGLPSAAGGDVVYVIQRAARPIPAWPAADFMRLTTRYARLADLTVLDGVGGTIAAALSEAPLTESLSLGVAATAFQALQPSMVPPGFTSEFGPGVGVGLYAAPHALSPSPTPATVGGFPLLPSPWMRLLFVNGWGPFAADANLGTIHYGGFLDSFWAEFLLVSYQLDVVQYTDPITGTRHIAYPAVSVGVPRTAAPATIVPAVGPPAAPRIASRDARAPQQGVGVTPLLSWGPPSVGTPDAYDVLIVPIDFGDSGLAARVHGVTSFRVPPGALVAGHSYYAMITAVVGPGYVEDMDPYVASLPVARADALTALFSP